MDNALYTVVLKKDEGWKKRVTVNKKDDLGAEIQYVVSEKPVDGFKQLGEASGDMEEGFVVTNELIVAAVTSGDNNTSTSTGDKTSTETIVVPSYPATIIPTLESPSIPSYYYPTTPVIPEVVTSSENPVAIIPVPSVSTTPIDHPSIDEDLDIIVDNVPRGDADLDIDIIGDDVPRGDTDLEDEDIDVSDNKTPRGGKVLAVTGGLNSIFLPILGMLAVILIAFFTVHFMIKKDK